MFKRTHSTSPARGSASAPGTGLQVCSRCEADFVHPVEWHEVEGERWWLHLRCGACCAEREVVVGDAVVQRYGDDLDEAEAQLTLGVHELESQRMAAEVEVFTEALKRDLIDAGDFAPREWT